MPICDVCAKAWEDSGRSTRWAVQQGWERSVYCKELAGDGVRALIYADGSIGIEHRCKWLSETEQLICAPKLQLANGGHTVTSWEPLEITPSIQCPDCDLHGFIRNSRWYPA